MERIQSLINKLKEQFEQQADADQMQLTIQLIQAELNHLKSGSSRKLGTSKVAVVMPAAANIRYAPKHETNGTTREETLVEAPQPRERVFRQTGSYFDPLIEIPTLSHQEGVLEINEAIAQQHESLNDKLNEKKVEIMEVLKDSPIRDLRKGIGINDRYLFISDLFRGDEPMYERSIKTINSFNLYTEAEYWMNRELKVKLGWDENRETVIHFYNLVKRRFI